MWAPENSKLTYAPGTKTPQLVPVTVDGNEYLLVDTPGFNDTWKDFKRSDATILGEIAQTLTIQSQLGVQLVNRFNPLCVGCSAD